MGYSPITPFRRTIDAVLLDHETRSSRAGTAPTVDKWQVLRDLATGREALGLSDRDLTVLQALISFHPGSELDPSAGSLVVHPANRTICERLNGMPCSTMRRHVAKLVSAGLLIRRDSPNGKRYARRTAGTKIAFGFDLSPLLHRAAEFHATAEATRAAQEELRTLRETASLLRRDLAELAAYGLSAHPGAANWDALLDMTRLAARTLRRQLQAAEVAGFVARFETALGDVRKVLGIGVEPEMSTSDARNEQHHTETKKDKLESEPLEVITPVERPDEPEPVTAERDLRRPPTDTAPSVPLSLVRDACPEMLSYARGPVTEWRHLAETADFVRPMMGIAPQVWAEALRTMGHAEASIVLAAMLERFDGIRSPDAYLRSLCIKAANGQFSAARMVLALTRKAAA